jgi:hypothetical protein
MPYVRMGRRGRMRVLIYALWHQLIAPRQSVRVVKEADSKSAGFARTGSNPVVVAISFCFCQALSLGGVTAPCRPAFARASDVCRVYTGPVMHLMHSHGISKFHLLHKSELPSSLAIGHGEWPPRGQIRPSYMYIPSAERKTLLKEPSSPERPNLYGMVNHPPAYRNPEIDDIHGSFWPLPATPCLTTRTEFQSSPN